MRERKKKERKERTPDQALSTEENQTLGALHMMRGLTRHIKNKCEGVLDLSRGLVNNLGSLEASVSWTITLYDSERKIKVQLRRINRREKRDDERRRKYAKD